MQTGNEEGPVTKPMARAMRSTRRSPTSARNEAVLCPPATPFGILKQGSWAAIGGKTGAFAKEEPKEESRSSYPAVRWMVVKEQEYDW